MRTIDEQPRPAVKVFEEVDKGHGRVEKRTVALCQDLSWLSTADRWPGLSWVVQVTRERTVLATEKRPRRKSRTISAATRGRAPTRQRSRSVGTGRLRTSCIGCSTWRFAKMKRATAPEIPRRT